VKAFFMQIQTRSADEPMTTFYKVRRQLMICAAGRLLALMGQGGWPSASRCTSLFEIVF